jgi:hypothetical protein
VAVPVAMGGCEMFRLTDEQMRILITIAKMLRDRERDEYLRATARRLSGRTFNNRDVSVAANAALREVFRNARKDAA